MSAVTGIQWTDRTWNPVTGCTKVSPGCAHCYAERLAPKVFHGQTVQLPMAIGGEPTFRTRTFTDVWTHEKRLREPLSWRKPSRVFVNSMSDLFHEDVPQEYVCAVWNTMARARRHTFQILTKRPAEMLNMVRLIQGFGLGSDLYKPWPLPNVWLGVSVENQHFADERIPLLLQTPAAVRFISAEPLLGPIDLRPHWLDFSEDDKRDGAAFHLQGHQSFLDWVIVGGESGPGARPFDVEWAYGIVQQCRAAGVPVFVKQLGANVHGPLKSTGGEWDHGRGHLKDRKGGDMAEWPLDLQVRQFPEARV